MREFPRAVEYDVQTSDLPRRIRSVDLGGRSPGRCFLLTANPFSLKHKLVMAEFARIDIRPEVVHTEAAESIKPAEESSTSAIGATAGYG
jgi:hypothetical protein